MIKVFGVSNNEFFIKKNCLKNSRFIILFDSTINSGTYAKIYDAIDTFQKMRPMSAKELKVVCKIQLVQNNDEELDMLREIHLTSKANKLGLSPRIYENTSCPVYAATGNIRRGKQAHIIFIEKLEFSFSDFLNNEKRPGEIIDAMDSICRKLQILNHNGILHLDQHAGNFMKNKNSWFIIDYQFSQETEKHRYLNVDAFVFILKTINMLNEIGSKLLKSRNFLKEIHKLCEIHSFTRNDATFWNMDHGDRNYIFDFHNKDILKGKKILNF